MLKRIANKMNKYQTAATLTGAAVPFKLLNHMEGGSASLRLDALAYTIPDSGIRAGEILTVSNGYIYSVVKVIGDYYKSEVIRNNLFLILNNNTITVTRPTPTMVQGRATGSSDVVIYAAIPCKTGTVSLAIHPELQTGVQKFIVLLSSLYPVQKGDKLAFGKLYESGVVEAIKIVEDGMTEITFDKDPRWLK